MSEEEELQAKLEDFVEPEKDEDTATLLEMGSVLLENQRRLFEVNLIRGNHRDDD